MNVKPLRAYSEANYPTLEEVQEQPHLLRRVPQRWRNPARWAAALGLGLLAEALHAESDATPAVAPPPAQRPDFTPAGSQAAPKPAEEHALVAPFLAEALQHDGRGSFGCMAVNPPAFLAEDEALELIRKELDAAGLKLKEAVPLTNVQMPVDERIEVKDEDGDRFHPRRSLLKFAPAEFAFDFADSDKSVYIEFLSARDHRQWEPKTNWASSVDSYDFPETAQIFARSLEKRTDNKRVYCGIFFDPLAHRARARTRRDGLTKEQMQLAENEERAAEHSQEMLRAQGMEKLRSQIAHLVQFLQKQGVVAAPKTGN